jgi:hypothetical protein
LGKEQSALEKQQNFFSPPIVVEPIEVPYEQTALPGYLYKVDGYSRNHDDGNQPKSRRPTLIAHGGFDSTLEKLYASAAAPALERGYNCITFEGPGQGGVIHKQNIPLDMTGKK